MLAGLDRWLGVATLAWSLGGCADPSADDPADEGDAASESEVEAPILVEPLDEVTISATQRQDLNLTVTGLGPSARIEIDGRAWSLTEPGPAVRDGELVRIPLAGAMVVGNHEVIFTGDVDEPDSSTEPLRVRVEAGDLNPLTASLDPLVVGIGDALIVGGPGQELLGLLDAEAQTLELRRGDWSAAGVIEPLPGLHVAAGPVVGAVDLRVVEFDQARALITTWMADGGDRVFARVSSIDGNDEIDLLGLQGPPIELWDLTDSADRTLLGPHELAANHAVALLDRMLVIGVEARRDAERSSPGDRLLVTRSLAADGSSTTAQMVRGPGSRDLDLPNRAQLWLDQGPGDPTLSIRLALAFPWLLELAGNGLPSLTGDPGELVDAPGSPVWMASADGALGSRHVFALELESESARIRALRIDRWGEPGLVEVPVVDVVELPGLPTAAPSLGSIAGAPTLVIAFGLATPAWAMRSTGESVILDEFVQLDCDALVVAQPLADGEGESQPIACLADRKLRIGSLGST